MCWVRIRHCFFGAQVNAVLAAFLLGFCHLADSVLDLPLVDPEVIEETLGNFHLFDLEENYLIKYSTAQASWVEKSLLAKRIL